jgi:YD repeat-containing protein
MDIADPDAAYFKPLYRRQAVQDGTTFTWQVTKSGTIYDFDIYTQPKKVTRSSSGGAGGTFSRTESTQYFDKTNLWVLSQVASVTDTATGKVMSQTTYSASTALPLTFSRFGVLQQTLTYNSDGTVATVKDPIHPATTLSSWYRGVPRSIVYPNGESKSAVVNAIGALTSTTDELNYSHGYGYDAMGRLSSITYPTGDTVAWNATTSPFTRVASSEYGIAAPHWKRVTATGNGRVTTFYDAQWRPVLVLTADTGSAGSTSFVVHRYDLAGRESFVSYPVGSLGSVNDSLKGTTTQYDALGRVTAVIQDAEVPFGTLTTTTQYLSGFKTRVTNPLGVKTETSYQVFDQPSTEAPVSIINAVSKPEQQTTTIVRDGFGKPLSITRSGTGG